MELRHGKRRQWWAALALALVGCSDTCNDTTGPGTVGELGNGRFHYTCGGQSDPACESLADGDYFPDCIALAGAFDLEYELLDDSALETNDLDPVLYIESVNQHFFRGTDDFEALRVGSAAFVVREGERVLDLIHLQIVEPDGIDVVTSDPATSTSAVEIAAGDTEVLRVFPRSSECLGLGGAVPIEADSSDAAVAGVSAGDVLRIEGLAPGTAVVRARLGELEQAITVTVVSGPIDPVTGEDSEGSSDTGTGTTDDTGTTDGTGTTGPGTGTTGETSGSSSGGSSTGGGT
jgi:hypothetical protein